MDLNEARALVAGPCWPQVRDRLAETGEFHWPPAGDWRRIELLDAETRRRIELWFEGAENLERWRKVIDGEEVRRLRREYPGVYPEVLRYAPHFAGRKDVRMVVLKLLFPEAYAICCS